MAAAAFAEEVTFGEDFVCRADALGNYPIFDALMDELMQSENPAAVMGLEDKDFVLAEITYFYMNMSADVTLNMIFKFDPTAETKAILITVDPEDHTYQYKEIYCEIDENGDPIIGLDEDEVELLMAAESSAVALWIKP